MKTHFLILICSFLLISSLSAINIKLCYPLTGWTPDSKKKFILSSDKEILTPISYSVQKNNETIKSGTLITEGYHWGFFLYSADISAITDSGIYTIKVPDYTEGTVEISNDIFKKFKSENGYLSIPDMLHSFWNYQRCYPEKCNNPNNDKKHQDDNNLPLYRSLPNNVRIQQAGTSKELYGGWHDATSTDKESFDIGGVVSQMGIAVLNMKDPLVVEPLLQEIRWGTDYLLKLQDDDGSFCVQVWIKADWIPDSPPRHLAVNKGIGVAARCALGLVVASEVFKNSDSGYSQKCLSAAKKAWDFVEKNPMKWMQDSIDDWWCGNSGTLVRTSAELARITGENRYITAVEKIIKEGTFNHSRYALF